MAEEGKKKWDGDGIPVADSNMAGVGGDEDKATRKQAAGGEPAWASPVGETPGIWIWRIESFKVVPWPKEKYGQFHEGDSYILLQVEFAIDEETGKTTEKLEYDIHFWLGKKTSTDEKGTAAYKTVELDSWFDDAATQHRETQGNESEMFLSYFPGGPLQYLPGGVESGFKVTQQDIFVTRLYQVRKHKRKVVIEEEAPALKSMNHRDSFIVEHGRKIYVWDGDNASPVLKSAANMRAEKMEGASNGEQTATHDIDDDFWEALGGKGEITAADAVGDEVAADFGEGTLFDIQVSEEDRSLTVKEVGRGDLKREMLDHTGVMMVDTRTEIFIWLGKDCSNLEKATAFQTASSYLRGAGRNVDKTSITVLKDGYARKNKTWAAMFPV